MCIISNKKKIMLKTRPKYCRYDKLWKIIQFDNFAKLYIHVLKENWSTQCKEKTVQPLHLVQYVWIQTNIAHWNQTYCVFSSSCKTTLSWFYFKIFDIIIVFDFFLSGSWFLSCFQLTSFECISSVMISWTSSRYSKVQIEEQQCVKVFRYLHDVHICESFVDMCKKIIYLGYAT